MASINITIKVLDYWIEDSIDRGFQKMKCYILMEIGNKLNLVERELEDV